MRQPDILVLGGGIIGLACARELASRGHTVELVERGLAGEAASAAAAGMLAPLAEVPESEPFFATCRGSRDLWPAWAMQLCEESGIDVDYDASGALAIDPDDTAELEVLANRAALLGEPVEWLARRDLQAWIPDLGAEIDRGLLLQGEHRVDNRRVCRALAKSLALHGVTIHENRPVVRISSSGSDACIESAGWRRQAGCLLVAAGAWSGAIAGLPALPVHPVRGQMLQLTGVTWPWRGSLRARSLYAVRRGQSELLIGATVEQAGFDAHTTPAGLGELFDFCRQLFPALGDHPLRSSWAGLRPGTVDGLPVLGRVADTIWLATGHYRNGILLAPWTAKAMADAIEGTAQETLPAAYAPQRFAAALPAARLSTIG